MSRIYLNKNWEYGENEMVDLPHSMVITPFHYFDEEIYQKNGEYKKILFAPKDWEGKSIVLTVEGSAHKTTVSVNRKKLKVHECGYTAFSTDLSEHLKFGETNEIRFLVESNETLNQPPFGNVIDYMTYGGIYRDVYLEINERAHISDIFVYTESIKAGEMSIFVGLNGENLDEKTQLFYCIREKESQRVKDSWSCAYSKENHFPVKDMLLWDLDDPVLYSLEITFIIETEHGKKESEPKSVVFGFRTAEFRQDGFYLNDRRVQLLGLNRHQSYPYVGYAMPKRPQQTDADILKFELGCNIVRTSHYPQSHYFLERCDEIGLLVLTEIPGWQHIGDDYWKEVACQNTKDMVVQYRNHPSIILWGVRINESQDDHEFYKKTNQIAHELDPSRNTGGIRNFAHSEFLEDVYTYNDFTNNGTGIGADKRKNVSKNSKNGYLVTEYNGHMFPTKNFDSEAHRREHAIRHALTIEDVKSQGDVAGGIGWCMFDYNTHKDFGSGDRICYHGVMDMFRNPKTAAYVYAAEGKKEFTGIIASTMDIGEHPAGDIGTIYGFTNCDSIRMYKNGDFVKEFYPDKKRFLHMEHPPILIDDPVGVLMETKEGYSHKKAEQIKAVLFAVLKYGQNTLPLLYKMKLVQVMLRYHLRPEDGVRLFFTYIGNWGGKVTRYHFDFIKDGQVVKTTAKSPVMKMKLRTNVDSQNLNLDESYDVASIRLQVVDQNQNLLPFYGEPVIYETKGPIELIGPKVGVFRGGMTGTYVKTVGQAGDAELSIKTGQIEEKITFHVN